MHVPSDAEIARFFDAITPEDFNRERADTTATTTEDELYPRHGSDEFERFVYEHLSELARDEAPFAVLHNGTTKRTFTPHEDEHLAQFLVRVSREVKSLNAQWLFLGAPGEASMGEVFNPTDPEAVRKTRDSGKMMDVVNWYSESIEMTSEEVRFGIIFHQDGEQKVVQSTYEEGANPVFRRVLHHTR